MPSLDLRLTLAPVLALALAPLACERGAELTEIPDVPLASAPACAGVEAIDAVWTGDRREQLRDALEQVPGEWPTQVLTTLDARVADNGARWRATYTQACAEGDQRAQRCLDAQLWQLDAVVALASDTPLRGATMWAEIDGALRDAEACAARVDPSFDAPALAPTLGMSWSSLVLLLDSSELAEAATLAAALDAEASLRESPAYALALATVDTLVAVWTGELEAGAASLAQVEALAAELGPRARVAAAQTAAAVAFARGDPQAGLLAAAEAVAAARDQADPWLLFTQLRELGQLRVRTGDADGALEPLAEAVSLSTRLAGVENPHTAAVQLTLAEALVALGRVEAAYDLLTQARDSFVNTLGPDHPQTLASVESIGQLFVRAGQPGDAQFAYLDLLEIYGELYGPKHWHTAAIKVELGDTLMAMEQHDSARTMYTEALVPLVEEFGPSHRTVIRAAVHLGIAEFALGNLEEAAKHCERAVGLVKALPPTDTLVAEAELCVAQLAKTNEPGRRRR